MRVWGAALEPLFLDGAKGMMSVLKHEVKSQKAKVKRGIELQSSDKTALLVDFLNEVLSLAQTNKEIYPEVVLKKLSETEVEAELKGMPVESFDEDIKAVTYHEAEVKQNKRGEWETMLVFDI
jgi:SHS2 domain-containing protein